MCAKQMSRVFIPNSFTPNGDTLNGILKPSISFINMEDYEFSVYDRWGNQLFKTTNPLEGWDGYAKNGKPAQEGIYLYKLIYTTSDNEQKEREGYIHLFIPSK